MKNRRAFTLAEVLITLGIIGIVAAMTMPSLIANNQKKQWETSLKKNYSVLQQALQRSYAENGIYVTGYNYPGSAKDELKKYLSVGKDCGFAGCIDYERRENGRPVDKVIKEYKNFNKNNNVATEFFDEGQIILNDGSFWMFENPYDGTYIMITIDVNGFEKGPNIWGYDLFTFQIMNNGQVLPMGTDGTQFIIKEQFCSPSSAHSQNGIGCTFYALTDENYWKNL